MSAHISVLMAESLAYLRPERGGLFVDCTVGLGGHTVALLNAGATRVIGIDRDTAALEESGRRLLPYGDRVDLVHADYRSVDDLLDARGVSTVDGVLADLGVSSMQLDAPGRGFSFQRDEPLDMRMDRSSGRPVSAFIADVSEEELADVIYHFGEERLSRRIARAIVRARHEAPIETTGHLASIVRRAVPRRGYMRIDPATRTFQALRIWVNHELEGSDRFIESIVRRLAIGARVVIISFHSLEDRLVKHTFRALEQSTSLIRVLTKKPVMAGEDEVAANPRARSAKLRAAERVA
jgi:16S rRNA (cytosine1402-N4)-methyltransferase